MLRVLYVVNSVWSCANGSIAEAVYSNLLVYLLAEAVYSLVLVVYVSLFVTYNFCYLCPVLLVKRGGVV